MVRKGIDMMAQRVRSYMSGVDMMTPVRLYMSSYTRLKMKGIVKKAKIMSSKLPVNTIKSTRDLESHRGNEKEIS